MAREVASAQCLGRCAEESLVRNSLLVVTGYMILWAFLQAFPRELQYAAQLRAALRTSALYLSSLHVTNGLKSVHLKEQSQEYAFSEVCWACGPLHRSLETA